MNNIPAALLVKALSVIFRLLFRVRLEGREHFPASDTAALIVANHVSLLDGVMLYLFLPRPVIFAINRDTAARWYVRPLLRLVTYVETDMQNPAAIKSLVRLLRSGRSIAIFPEGRITTTGNLMKIYDGPGIAADKADVVIVPVAIAGLEYSRWSLLKGMNRLRAFPRVTLTILPPRRLELAAQLHGAERRTAATHQLARIMHEIAYTNAFHNEALFPALVRAARTHGYSAPVVEDSSGARLNYGDLITRSFVLGSLIAGLTGKSDRVGIMLPSTAAAIVTLFACQARGREAAMLNFTAGPYGLVTAIETAGIKIVFSSRAFVEAGSLEDEAAAIAEHAELIYLEDLRERIGIGHKLAAVLAAHAPLLAHRLLSPSRSADDPAVILFTSGSEGIPKGVVLSHNNLLANFAQVSMLIDLTHRDRLLNVLPIFHAFGLLGGVLLPLLKGAPSYQYPNPLHYRLVPELCYEIGATCLFGTNTFLRGYGRSAHPYDLHRLRFVVAGGEKMTEEVQRLWNQKFGIRIFEGYGTTEASPVLAVNNPLANRTGTVGQLLTGMDYYLRPIAGIAEGGELVVRGPNIMRGYLFHGSDGEIIPPWTDAHDAGWYNTGDIVNVDAECFITILGRAKRFAKIGGEMISLAAVEDLAVTLWPDGHHAALILSDPRKGEQIVLVTNTQGAERAELVALARAQRVSEMYIPRRIILLESLPLLGSGKIDYSKLRDAIARSQ